MDGCPVHVKIPNFIIAITKGDFKRAAAILKEDNALPAVCGRVCPQEAQCELCLLYTSDAADDLHCVHLGGRRIIKQKKKKKKSKTIINKRQ